MRKLLFLDGSAESYRDALNKVAPGWLVVDGAQAADLSAELREAEILIGWNHQAELESLRPDSCLRWVQSLGAGVNGMPLNDFQERGIALTCASGVHPYPISEVILAMMLAYVRKINLNIQNQQNHIWQHQSGLSEIHGKTIGIVGVGAIGEETARLAKAFKMTVIGLRRSGQPAPHVDVMYDTAGLPDLLRQSDFVVNILPLTAETRRLMGQEQFHQMKANAFYINVGRGETTDTEALIRALQDKRLAGAGLDVTAPEPLPADSPLWDMPNVIITPHSAGANEHYFDRVMDIFLANLPAYLQDGEPNISRVDLSLGY
jgi:phosphoglycerate dehydrogenase-like enzyme